MRIRMFSTVATFVILTIFGATAGEPDSVLTDTDVLEDSSSIVSVTDSLTPEPDSLIQDSVTSQDTLQTDSTGKGKDSLQVESDSLGQDTTQAEIDSAQIIPEETKNKPEKELYPGVSPEQDRLALAMVEQVYSFNWKKAGKIGKKMQRLEKKHDLPPLSYLLLVSMNIFRIQNNEYSDNRSYKKLLKDIRKLSKKGLELSLPDSAPDSLKTMHMLIHAGIKGFNATLKMSKNPIESAIEGMGALKLLEQQVKLAPSIKDGYLGLGIFYCAVSKAPTLVRAAVNVTGRKISLEKGLGYLRKAAYEGQYTYGVAQMYLIQFLSPYYGHMVEEKKRIFSNLQKRYPTNPYYVFLELDETLCFHPSKLTLFTTNQRYKQKIRMFSKENHSLRKYCTLVKLQYRMINPLPPEDIEPDNSVDLKEFEFYPVFLQALREKLLLNQESSKNSDHQKRIHFIKKKGQQAKKLLESSDIGKGRKGFYIWHIEDALNL
ncbi:MAG: hypothetical protein ACLFVQ_08020 [Chitinispirillaceae bacterium]